MPTKRNLGPPPPSPRKFHRDFDKHGHHRSCPHSHWHSDDENEECPFLCDCAELDESDYYDECERRMDAWRAGDFADGEEP